MSAAIQAIRDALDQYDAAHDAATEDKAIEQLSMICDPAVISELLGALDAALTEAAALRREAYDWSKACEVATMKLEALKSDPKLCKFYGVTESAALVHAMERTGDIGDINTLLVNRAELDAALVDAELLGRARLLCEWIQDTPHQRGSINGIAAQLYYAIAARAQEQAP
jgi:hypothetical protein